MKFLKPKRRKGTPPVQPILGVSEHLVDVEEAARKARVPQLTKVRRAEPKSAVDRG